MVHLGPITVTVAEDGGRGRKTFYYEPAHFGRRDYMPGAVMRRDGPGRWWRDAKPPEPTARRTED